MPQSLHAQHHDSGGRLVEHAIKGEFEAVRNLLEAGVPPDASDANKSTALIQAAAAGNLAMVDLLIAKGADVNHIDGTGFTALIEASRHGHPEVVRALIHAGADMTVRVGETGQHALQYALDGGYADVAELMRDHPKRPKGLTILRGVESFDMDTRILAVHDDLETVADTLKKLRGLREHQRNVYGKRITLQPQTLLLLKLREHKWTVVAELHIERGRPRFTLDEAKRLSHDLGAKVVLFATSDVEGAFAYKYWHAGELEESLEIHGSDAGVDAKRVFWSNRRKIEPADLANPEEFTNRFFNTIELFIPAIGMGVGKTGDEGELVIPGYSHQDFERVDLLSS
jgi:ankyrin repeat protein